MLRFLRKYSSSTGVKILYGLLAVAFAAFGVGVLGGERVDLAARVRGEDITRRELERTTQLLRQRYETLRIPAEMLRGIDLRAQALDQLVEQALLRQAASRLGLGVTDDDVVRAITTMPELQDNGRFDRDRLAAFLAAQRDRGEFESDIRSALVLERVRAVVTDAVDVTPAEVTARFHLDRDKVALRFVRLRGADLAKDVSLTDDELQKYLDEHAARYVVPTRVRVRYVAFRTADFAAQVHPTDGEIAAYYELHKDERFSDPERVRARHILLRVKPDATDAERAAIRQKAQDLLAKVKAGGDFAALAKADSEDPASAAKGGDLGLFPRGRMTPEFEAVAFALDAGQSDLVETPFGIHVVQVEEHRQAGPRPLEAVRDEITKILADERGYERARHAAEAARAAVVNAKSLAEAAEGRPVIATEPFTIDAAVPGVGREKAFSETAFALADGEVSDLVETENTIYLLSPFERVEAHAPPLAEVRERVEADARRERGADLARERGEKLLARAREIGLAPAAAEAGIEVEETGPFDRRGGTIPTLGAVEALRTDAFGLTPEAPLGPRVYQAGDDAVVAALAERLPADEAELEPAKADIRRSLVEQKRQAAFNAFLDDLKQRAAREGALEVFSDTPARS